MPMVDVTEEQALRIFEGLSQRARSFEQLAETISTGHPEHASNLISEANADRKMAQNFLRIGLGLPDPTGRSGG